MSAVSPRGIYIGTSGFAYSWKWYPRGIQEQEKLSIYAAHFPTVEINYSFYRLPSQQTIKRWRKAVPHGFLFAVKLSRFITHIKRLRGIAASARLFFTRVAMLGSLCGPILIQLPPHARWDPSYCARIRSLREYARRAGIRAPKFAVEARHPSWFAPEVRPERNACLRAAGAAFVFAHSARYPYPVDEPITARFVYLRFHGPRELFSSGYGRRALVPWARKIRSWRRRGIRVFAYFNNDAAGDAPYDAQALLQLVGAGRTMKDT